MHHWLGGDHTIRAHSNLSSARYWHPATLLTAPFTTLAAHPLHLTGHTRRAAIPSTSSYGPHSPRRDPFHFILQATLAAPRSLPLHLTGHTRRAAIPSTSSYRPHSPHRDPFHFILRATLAALPLHLTGHTRRIATPSTSSYRTSGPQLVYQRPW